MNPNLTIYSMVQAIERERLDANASRGHQIAEAVATRPARSPIRALCWTAGAALLRVGAFLQRSAQDVGTVRQVASEKAC